MFESGYMLKTTKFAFEDVIVEKDYARCWQGLQNVHIEADDKK
jgi:homogentisate 1,2-dioxygenase